MRAKLQIFILLYLRNNVEATCGAIERDLIDWGIVDRHERTTVYENIKELIAAGVLQSRTVACEPSAFSLTGDGHREAEVLCSALKHQLLCH